jgi:uncharacterized membrane protein
MQLQNRRSGVGKSAAAAQPASRTPADRFAEPVSAIVLPWRRRRSRVDEQRADQSFEIGLLLLVTAAMVANVTSLLRGPWWVMATICTVSLAIGATAIRFVWLWWRHLNRG